LAVTRRVSGVTRDERLLLLRLLAWDWHWESGGWLVLVVVGRHVGEGRHTYEGFSVVIEGKVQQKLRKFLDQVNKKEEREKRPTPSEQPHFIPIGDEHSCHHPADEA